MEKSIESIWKEGFLKSDVLVAPKLNDLYNKKSQHIVDKFTRMFRTNLIMIVLGSFFVVGISFAVHIPYMGIGMFILLNILVIINIKLMKGLNEIDKNVNSYQYIKAFDSWMKKQFSLNKNFAHFLYPLVFISMLIGFWCGDLGGDVPGDQLVNDLTMRFPDMVLFLGLPLYGLLGFVLFLALVIYFAGTIYNWDFNIVYGRLAKKLTEIIADMEELKS
ncbi:MAG: hypothetical protein OCD76_22440 [Reichenbachiella sp.]